MRILKTVPHLAVFALLIAATSAGAAEGDVERGKKVFNKCKACHVLDAHKNRVGPYLSGVIGRTAGTADGYKYSKANAQSGIVWTEEVLFEYLANPRAYLKGTKMAFPGLKDPQDRRDVIAYIKQNGGAK